MPSIDIRREHSKTIKDARQSVERVAERIAERFDVEYAWDGNTLNFQRSGVDGHIMLSKGEVHVRVNLGFLLSMLRAPIEGEIHKQIDHEFA